MNVDFLYDDIVHVLQNTIDSCINSATDRRGGYTPCPGKKGTTFFAITLPNLTDLQNSFTVTLSSKFAIKKSLNIPPSFTHVATLPCKTVVLNCKFLAYIKNV